jgi:hypothetical protein
VSCLMRFRSRWRTISELCLPGCVTRLSFRRDFMGPYRLTLSAAHLMIAAKVDVSLQLLHPPTELTLDWLRVDLVQSANWTSPDPRRTPDWSESSSHRFVDYPANQRIPPLAPSTHRTHGRLPHDEEVTYSTLDGSITPLRVSHHLVVQVAVTLPEGNTKLVRISRPIFLAYVSAQRPSVRR